MEEKWKVFWDPKDPHYKEREKIAKNLSLSLGISDFLSKLLVSRNITNPEEADIFLNYPEKRTYDPFLMQDMSKAVEILKTIKQKKEKIAIFGDYDVDGVTSCAVLYLGMKKLGFEVTSYIPSRIDEGYSLNEKAIFELKSKGYNNLVTVDCGTTSLKEIDYAKSLGMRVIVTDHHIPKDELPNADAILNPKRNDCKYPFKDLAGVGVTFKLLQALFETFDKSLDPFEYIDLVAVGTIADIVSILSENRYFVIRGIEKLKTNPTKGLAYLLNELKIVESEIDSRTIAYKVAPKINAAGRMANAYAAFKLLTLDDEEKINKAVSDLLKLNSKRQSTEREIYLYALSLLDLHPEYKDDDVLVLSGENWHLGVLGIVASKLSSQLNKPVLMISKSKDICKGSGRSPQGIDLMELLLKVSKENILEEFGGHKLAAGFSCYSKNIEALRKSVNKIYKELYEKKEISYYLEIDMEIDSIFPNMFEDLEKLEPFGYMNPEPLFLIKNAKIENFKFFSNGSQNFSGILRNDNSLIVDVLGYDLGINLLNLNWNKRKDLLVDVVGTFRIENSYNLKNSYIKFYLQDLSIKESFFFEESSENDLLNPILKDELDKISQIEVLNENLYYNKIAMFLPSKLKNVSLIKKILLNLESKKKVILISGTKSLLEHSYKIISSYLPENILFINKYYSINSNVLSKYEVFFLTVPEFLKHIALFDSIDCQIIIDEPFYTLFHPVIRKVRDFIEFRDYIFAKQNVSMFGALYDENLKELLKNYGFKILMASSANNNFEVTKERGSIVSIMKEYIDTRNSRVIVLNEPNRQKSLIKLMDKKLNINDGNVKVFNHSMSYREKMLAREEFRREYAYLYVTSFSNNGLALETKGYPTTIIILDVPKTALEFLDLVSGWTNKNQKISIVFGYDKKFKVRLMYDYAKKYPSFKILKKTYDFIKANNPEIDTVVSTLFKGENDLAFVVLGVLQEANLIKIHNEDIEITNPFDLKKLRDTSNFKENILDSWLLKNSIYFYENLDTREFIEFLKGDTTKIGARGV